MARDAFRDAAGTINGGALWEWPVGHEEEDPMDKSLALTRSAVTSGVGYVRQQGTPTPTVVKLKGWIKTKSQLEIMEAFYNACAGIGTPSRTVFYRDVEGVEHEVLITDFKPQRVRSLSNRPWFFEWKHETVMEYIT